MEKRVKRKKSTVERGTEENWERDKEGTAGKGQGQGKKWIWSKGDSRKRDRVKGDKDRVKRGQGQKGTGSKGDRKKEDRGKEDRGKIRLFRRIKKGKKHSNPHRIARGRQPQREEWRMKACLSVRTLMIMMITMMIMKDA
jgi:hypothetical protein